MARHLRSRKAEARRGAATVFTAVTVVGLGAMSLGLLAMNLTVEKEQRTRQRALTSFYAAEAGLSASFQNMLNGGDGAVASQNIPEEFGSAEYYVVSEDQGDRQTALVAVGSADGSVARAELVVRRVPNGLFQYAAFGDEGLTLASSTFVDSYDSEMGTYAAQVGASGHANEKGSVGSNMNVIMLANTEVYGNVTPGVAGILDDDAPLTTVTGSTDPMLAPVAMPAITVPAAPAVPALSTLANVAVVPGHYHYPSIVVNGGNTLTIAGPAVIVVDSFTLRSNSGLVIDATSGPVEIYGTGTFDLRSNTTVTTYADSALDIAVNLTADNYGAGAGGSTIALNSNAAFTGTIYAPNAKVVVASNFEVFGGVMSDVLEIASNSNLHYDEQLAYEGPGATMEFETLLWRPVGAQ